MVILTPPTTTRAEVAETATRVRAKAAFALPFLTLSQHFNLQWRNLVMLKYQTKLIELQAYVGTFAMIRLQ